MKLMANHGDLTGFHLKTSSPPMTVRFSSSWRIRQILARINNYCALDVHIHTRTVVILRLSVVAKWKFPVFGKEKLEEKPKICRCSLEMACVGATCGDVELREIPLSLPREEDGDAGDERPSSTEREDDVLSDDDEEAGLLGTPKSGESARHAAAEASTSSSPSTSLGFLSRLPKGEAVMFCGTFILAFQNIVAKTVERGVPPMQVVFVRSLISGSVTFGTLYRRHVSSSTYDKSHRTTLETFLGPKPMWQLCLVRGVVGSIAFSLAYVSLTYLTVNDSVAIFFLNPIFSTLLAWPVLGERIGGIEGLSILCGLLGTLLIVKPPSVFNPIVESSGFGHTIDQEQTPHLTGVVVTVISAACCSIAMVTIRTIGKRVSPLSLAGWFHTSSTVCGFISCVIQWPLPPVSPTAYEWSLLLLLSVTSFFGQLSLNYGYSHLPTLTASAMYYLMVVWSALLGVLVMKEHVDVYSGCGAVVICLGGLGPSANKARVARKEQRRRRIEVDRG